MDKVDWLNSFIGKQKDFKVTQPFILIDDKYRGAITLDGSPKESLSFVVEIPISYPLIENGKKCCCFIIKNDIDSKHINEDKSICLIIPTCFNFEYRFELELNALREWRDNYYLDNFEEEKYDYPIAPNQRNISFLFTDLEKTFKRHEYGIVEGIVVNNHANVFGKELDAATVLITKFGDAECDWSKAYSQGKQLGYYYFIEDEPIAKKGILQAYWKGLEVYLQNNFKELLFNNFTKAKSNLNFLFLGYKIRNTQEIHWLAIKIKGLKPFIKKSFYVRNAYIFMFENDTIEWHKTQNISYNRYFGRGAISTYLKSKKILILGVGAIGSSLAKILTRTGALDITLSDYDTVEVGNLCRGEFSLLDVGMPKIHAIQRELRSISPYVNVDITYLNSLKNFDATTLTKNLTQLNEFDFIFNCTADDELIYAIDQLKPRSTIINLSVTNKANELLCFTGKDIIEQLNYFNPSINTNTHKFYEGTGCWSWTFQASYFDINAMLHLAIKNINKRLNNQEPLRSFIVKATQDGYENLTVNAI